MLNIAAFIHAKAHSERLPGKNLLLLGGVPLFVHAVRAALAAESVDEVYVDSDSEEILQIGKECGANSLVRPSELATNETTGDALVYWQAANVPRSDVIVQVVPTSPFIRPETIDRAINYRWHLAVDSVVGVRTERLYLWQDGRSAYRQEGRLPNSNELPGITRETTGLYVVRRDYARAKRQRINPKSCYPLEMSHVEAIDINTQEDYEFAKLVMAGLKATALLQVCGTCKHYDAIGRGLHAHGGCRLGEPCRFDPEDRDRPLEEFPAYRFPLRLPDRACQIDSWEKAR